jgi:hypothetical protein
MSLIETLRRAVTSGPIAALADEPGAQVSTTEASDLKEQTMSDQNALGAALSAGISEAVHKAAVTKAEADGHAAGAKAAGDRLVTVLGAEGIKGDGKRMGAALDLATKSPGMAATEVVSFVTDNVAASATDGTSGQAAAYEQQRLAASDLVQPNGGKAAEVTNKSVLSAAVDRTNKRNRR